VEEATQKAAAFAASNVARIELGGLLVELREMIIRAKIML
jgi:hypothetical protein